jgi:hypothetical protein
VTLRGLLKFDDSSTSDHHHHHPSAVPLEEVEAVEEIVKRFVTGAMSLGSISQVLFLLLLLLLVVVADHVRSDMCSAPTTNTSTTFDRFILPAASTFFCLSID